MLRAVESSEKPRQDLIEHTFCKQAEYRENTLVRDLIVEEAGSSEDSAESRSERSLLAHSLEFVAKPGTTEALRTNCAPKIRKVLEAYRNFRGCMILAPEQETRIVTFLVLWNQREADNEVSRGWNMVKTILSPYVDRWLRSRDLEAFVSMQDPSNNRRLRR